MVKWRITMKLETLFTNELIETTYLYAYKNVYDKNVAEDLAQDILTEAITSFNKNGNIQNFHAWFWKVARNEVIRYVGKKQNKAVILEDINYINNIAYSLCEPSSTEDLLFSTSKLISRLSSEHRQIIIMFYLQKFSIKEISETLHLPIGTVKYRLYEARTKAKKEKKKMKEKRFDNSYAYAIPKVHLYGGGMVNPSKVCLPIYRTILVVCANDELTINEISEKMNVSPVYLEEYVNYLVKEEFLKKLQNKYISNIIMIDQLVIRNTQNKLVDIYKPLAKDFSQIINSKKDDITSLNFYGNNFDYDELKWFLYPFLGHIFGWGMKEKLRNKISHMKFIEWGRNWRLAGVVTYPEDKEVLVNNVMDWSQRGKEYSLYNGKRVFIEDMFTRWPFAINRLEDRINESNVDLIMKIFDNPKLEVTEKEKLQVALLLKNEVIKNTEDGFILNIPVMSEKVHYKEISSIVHDDIYKLVDLYFDKVVSLFEEEVLPEIRKELYEQFYNFFLVDISTPINVVLYELVNRKELIIPIDCINGKKSNKMYGVTFTIR